MVCVYQYRFTIRFLLVLTAVIGLALAAMRYPTKSATIIAVSGTFAILAGAVIGALTSRGSLQACCVGFAVAGWLHAIIVFTNWFGRETGSVLVSFYVLHSLAPIFGNSIASNMAIEQPLIQNALANYVPGSPPALFYKYMTIGQSLFTILAGALGAGLASYFHTRSANHPKSN